MVYLLILIPFLYCISLLDLMHLFPVISALYSLTKFLFVTVSLTKFFFDNKDLPSLFSYIVIFTAVVFIGYVMHSLDMKLFYNLFMSYTYIDLPLGVPDIKTLVYSPLYMDYNQLPPLTYLAEVINLVQLKS